MAAATSSGLSALPAADENTAVFEAIRTALNDTLPRFHFDTDLQHQELACWLLHLTWTAVGFVYSNPQGR